MGHRLGVASGKNEFDRRLGNFRVQIKLDEGEHVATITASILAPRSLSEHLRSPAILSAVGISTPAPDALRLAISILRAAQEAGLRLPTGPSAELRQTIRATRHGSSGREIEKGKGRHFQQTPQAKKKADGAHAIRRPAISL
jgi:hypothetical protein